MNLLSILQLRCPHCHEGAVYRAPFRMNPTCPVCGVRFEREEGYFMMAVFVGYVMGFVIGALTLLLLYLTLRPSLWGYVIWTGVVVLLTAPVTFHYARVIWMAIDERLDPRRPAELAEAAQRVGKHSNG